MKKNNITEIQLRHQQELKERREAVKERKARAHRLIVRGAIAEAAISGASDMTDEQFHLALYLALGKEKAIANSFPQEPYGSIPRKSLSGDPAMQA